MPHVACSLVLLPWTSVTFLSCGELMNRLGEGTLDFCISHILFGVRAFFSRQPVSVDFTPVGVCAAVEMLMMLRVLPGVFALGRSL